MITVLNVYLVSCITPILIGAFLLAKNHNACENRCKIIDAIYAYDMYMFSLGSLNHTNLYDAMESYNSTMYRLWDWGYTRILPPEYFQLIEPFIER